MAVYSYNYKMKMEILGGSGTVETVENAKPANGKLFYDNDIPAGAFSFSPHLSENETPLVTGLKFYDDTGFTMALDGVPANQSDNKFSEVYIEHASVTPPAPPKLDIVTTVKAQTQVIGYGDPLPA